jgi:ABC-type lipoprotein release transport system permease subunit
LKRLQQDLEQPDRVNTLLVADKGTDLSNGSALARGLRDIARPEDYGLKLRTLLDQQALAIESSSGLIDRARLSAINAAADVAQMAVQPVFTYLANTMRANGREVPYSLVTATDLSVVAPGLPATTADGTPPIVINEWVARELGARAGDPLTLEYYLWQEPGLLETRSAQFRIASVVPLAGAAADRDLSPVYPGITEADTLGDWDPPFPIDLKRVRPQDEAYWKEHRATPKAFIAFEQGQALWRSRYGDRTSVRIRATPGQPIEDLERRLTAALRPELDPQAMGLMIRAAKDAGLAASAGSTDFGEYFVYFSFFLVASALVLATLFFRLGVEQRAREVGLLRAVGFSTPRVRRLFTLEGVLLATIGSAIGIAGAIGYGALMMAGLRTWWSGAVGTTALTLHVSPVSLAGGAIGAMLVAVGCIWWTLRGLSRLSERALLAGSIEDDAPAVARRRSVLAPALAGFFLVVGLYLMLGGAVGSIDRSAAFFGAGTSILVACLFAIAWWLRRRPRGATPAPSVRGLGFRNTTERPGRSVLAIAVIASATFILISVDAFRRGDIDPTDRHSGTGGYPLLVDLLMPLINDPNSRDAREALGLPESGVTVEAFRVLPGEDASCLNLYAPVNPRILGVSQRVIESGRFAFQGSLAESDADRANPWTLLTRTSPDAAIPIAADANSMTYVLHKKLGDEIVVQHGAARVRLRLVAALADSIFQGELLMSESNFVRLFPEQQGYRFLLIDAPAAQAASLGETIERTASDLGADATPAAQRLAEFHAVENTYLSTFQSLGGLGLLVGTLGLAAVLLRNVFERRREIALLRAVGYAPANLFSIVAAENAVLLGCGLAVGAISALVAIAPTALERGVRIPVSSGGWLLLLAVVAAALLSSLVATRAALRESLLAALRSE